MGTNFYLRRNLTKEESAFAIRMIECKNYEYAEQLLSKTAPIHIGKRSFGWKFLWEAHNFRYFDKNKESINEFLKTGTIFDEYGKEYDLSNFWNVELEGCIDEGHDLSTYYKEHPELEVRLPLYSIDRFKKLFNIEPDLYGEFYIDGLRFTISENFS